MTTLSRYPVVLGLSAWLLVTAVGCSDSTGSSSSTSDAGAADVVSDTAGDTVSQDDGEVAADGTEDTEQDVVESDGVTDSAQADGVQTDTTETDTTETDTTETDTTEEDTSTTDTTSEDTTAVPESWTVLVYMVADNDLEGYALKDLVEMAEVGSNETTHVVVQIDRAAAHSSEKVLNLGDFQSAKRLLVKKGELVELEDIGEPDCSTPDPMSEFIKWAVDKYPAKRYALIFWDHGGGHSGFGQDESAAKATLTLSNLAKGLKDGVDGAGIGKFDLIGFDACLMATLEVAQLLAPSAHYMVASQDTEPGHGWDWMTLETLVSKPATTAVELGTAIIDDYIKQSKLKGTFAQGVTLSLIDLGKIPDLVAAITKLKVASESAISTNTVEIIKARGRSKEFGRNPNPAGSVQQHDLNDLMEQFSADKLGDAASIESVQAALKAAVVHTKVGKGNQAAAGLSVYFPASEKEYKKGYDAIEGASEWRDFLKSVLGAGESKAIQPKFINPKAEPILGDVVDGIQTYTATLEPGQGASITEQRLITATTFDGNILFMGSGAAKLIGDQVSKTAGPGFLVVKEEGSEKMSLAYTDVTFEEIDGKETMVALVPFATSPELSVPDVVLRIAFLESGNDASFISYSETGAVAAFPYDESTILYPMARVYFLDSDVDTFFTGPQVGFSPSKLYLDFFFPTAKDLPGEQFVVLISATAIGGASTSVVGFYPLPEE